MLNLDPMLLLVAGEAIVMRNTTSQLLIAMATGMALTAMAVGMEVIAMATGTGRIAMGRIAMAIGMELIDMEAGMWIAMAQTVIVQIAMGQTAMVQIGMAENSMAQKGMALNGMGTRTDTVHRTGMALEVIVLIRGVPPNVIMVTDMTASTDTKGDDMEGMAHPMKMGEVPGQCHHVEPLEVMWNIQGNR